MAQRLTLIYCYFSAISGQVSSSGKSVCLKTDSTQKFLEERKQLPEGFLHFTWGCRAGSYLAIIDMESKSLVEGFVQA